MDVFAEEKPDNFVYVTEIIPNIKQDMRYFGSNNFVGRPITGYKKPVCILSSAAAHALLKVQTELNKQNLGLLVYDCYRPQMAVDDFILWSQNSDEKTKSLFYPHFDKKELFKRGYIARRSGHTRGSTVDLTIVDLASNQVLDMGTPFDYLDPLSHPDNRDITPEQFKNRMLLRSLMIKHGFMPIRTEWWHFTLKNEPYKNTYFNFFVE
ncbi:M15 family metallopeptidase [Rickettsiella endosymbiont of Miltochrista miniata]|uniref:M15 family metallopeptidase n=1 Tax=Rickettsiella endosymbiont of Miltochrista miniata TaxID=3066239 RepID=UPI00313DB9C3